MPRAAIFGCGPAGLLAAYACRQAGYEVQIFSRKVRSPIHGAQFIGELPAGIEAPGQQITIELLGTADEYRRKVYGPDYDGPVSPMKFVGTRMAYDLRVLYNRLWGMFSESVVDAAFTAKTFGPAVTTMARGFELVFSSIPLDMICENREHEFTSQQIFAIGDAPGLGVRCPIRVPANSIVYSGNDLTGWYRAADIFGHRTAEWPAHEGARKPPLGNIARIRKPLSTNCTCHPGVIRVGRYGEWKKGVLSIDAYKRAKAFATAKGIQNALW